MDVALPASHNHPRAEAGLCQHVIPLPEKVGKCAPFRYFENYHLLTDVHLSHNDEDVISLINAHYTSLSPSGRAIANFLQQHPDALLSHSLADIAQATQTSKASVSRFFRQSGLDSHQDAKHRLLSQRSSGVPVHTVASNIDQAALEIRNVATTLENISAETLTEISQHLATASRITLLGFRNAYPLALHFRQQLKQIRTTVRVLPQPGQTLSEDLHDMASDELVVLFGFRRRTRIFKKILNILSSQTTVMITDPTGQVYRDKVNYQLVCHLGQDAPFDSYAAPMSVVSLLCNQVYQELGEKAVKRVQSVSSLYDELEELEHRHR